MATATETMSAEIVALTKLIEALEGGRIKPEDREALAYHLRAMLTRKQKALAVGEKR